MHRGQVESTVAVPSATIPSMNLCPAPVLMCPLSVHWTYLFLEILISIERDSYLLKEAQNKSKSL